jgi:hypothetical protein
MVIRKIFFVVQEKTNQIPCKAMISKKLEKTRKNNGLSLYDRPGMVMYVARKKIKGMDMWAQIIEQLSIIEEQNSITILYACESGSRAWGFASTDSDWDERFFPSARFAAPLTGCLS